MLNYITWTVSPNLFDGPPTIRWYGLMFAIGFYVGYEIVSRIFKHEGAPERWLGSLFIYVVVATIVGARLGHVFFYEWDVYKQNPIDIFKIWEGGLAIYGGIIGAVLTVFVYCRVKRIPVGAMLDLGGMGLLIGYGPLTVWSFLRDLWRRSSASAT